MPSFIAISVAVICGFISINNKTRIALSFSVSIGLKIFVNLLVAGISVFSLKPDGKPDFNVEFYAGYQKA